MAVAFYCLLGPLEVRTDGTPIRPPSSRQRLLLAVLLVDANRMVTTDRLAEELWGDALPTSPPSALRTQISRLRRALGPAAGDLLTEAGGYRLLVEPSQLDATKFRNLLLQAAEADPEPALELLDEALALWRGHALDEFADRPFAQASAVTLEELRAGAQEQRAEVLLHLGLVDEALAALEAFVAVLPFRERARGLLMEALYRAGRHTEALDSYRDWCRRLADELGLDPSPELRRIEQKILEHTLTATDATTTAARGSAIPMPISSFVGREQDLSSIASLLRQVRLVTLCGPGGVGKTRLALELLRAVEKRYADGVCFCDLVAVRRPTFVVRVVATAVGLVERNPRHIDDQLIEHLGERLMLIVLDNCEHLAEPSGAIAERIVRQSPGVDVLVTSRASLGVDGEHVWQLAPLDARGPDASAVRLFVDRARALDPSLNPDADDREVIASICNRLDGLPLAIELAAARLRGLSLNELERNLDQRFRLLASEHRADKRHRSLRAVVDWSYEQLRPEEQRVFERLCVFAGRFDMDAARAVVGGDDTEGQVTAAVLSLVDRSLVSPHREDGATRYALLDTIRAYGIDRLEERNTLAVVRDRHAAWAVQLAERASVGLASPAEGEWAQTLRMHLDELRAAHAWLVGRDAVSSLRLIAALHWFALWQSESEVFRWAEAAAASAGEIRSPLLPTVLASVAAGAWLRGELEAAEAAARAAAEAARGLDPITGRRALEALADVALQKGALERSVALFRDASERARAGGYLLEAVWDIGSIAVALAYGGRHEEATGPAMEACELADATGSPSARAIARYFLGEVRARTDAVEAERHLRQAIELAESVGSRFIVGLAHVTLGSLYARHGDAAAALRYYERVIQEWQRTSNWMTLWVTLRNLVDLLSRVGAWNEAAVLYGAIRSSDTAPPYGADEVMLREVEARLREELGDEAFSESAEKGTKLSVDDVAAVALDAARRTILKCP